MSKTFDTPDHYASAVVAHLTARPKRAGLAAGGAGGTQGFSRKDAVKIVQSNEASVRNAYTARVSPEFLAARLARSATVRTQRAVAGLAAGMAASSERFIHSDVRGINPASFLRGSAGFSAATATVPAGNVVCPSDGWMPALFLNRDQLPNAENDPTGAVETFDALLLPDEKRSLFQKAKGQTYDAATEARELDYARFVAQRTAANAEAALEKLGRKGMPRFLAIKQRVEARVKLTKSDRAFFDKFKKPLGEPDRIEKQVERFGVVGRVVEIIKDSYPSAIATNKTGDTWQVRSAIFAEDSGNEKIESRLPSAVADSIPFKQRGVATTYAPIERACPSSCVLKDSPASRPDAFGNKKRGSCYAQTSNNILPIVIMLDGIAKAFDLTPDQIADDEARALVAGFPNGMKVPLDIRLHTSGDTQTARGARLLASAITQLSRKQRWRTVAEFDTPKYSQLSDDQRRAVRSSIAKLTQPMRAWTYTHAWRNMRPSDWRPISCIASVTSHNEAREAYLRGWATTIVVDEGTFARYATTPDGRSRAFVIAGDVKVVRDAEGPREIRGDAARQPGRATPAPNGDGDRPITWIPCPAQHPDDKKKIGCVNCRLCFDADRLHSMGMGIAFEAHGSGKSGAITYGNAEHLISALSLVRKKDERSLEAEQRKVEKFEAGKGMSRGQRTEPKGRKKS